VTLKPLNIIKGKNSYYIIIKMEMEDYSTSGPNSLESETFIFRL